MLRQITVTELTDVIIVDSPKGRHIRMENRRNYGLSLCQSGQITYIHNGISYVSDANHAILLPKGQNYELFGDDSGLFPVINFDYSGNLICDRPILFSLRHSERHLAIFHRLKELHFFERNYAKSMSTFYELLDSIASDCMHTNSHAWNAQQYIELHFTEADLQIRHIAEHCGISEVYLRKIFHDTFEQSPHQYLTGIRMKMAKNLLSEGILPIGEIAIACGYSSVYHFSRAFRQSMGISATQYSASHQRISI